LELGGEEGGFDLLEEELAHSALELGVDLASIPMLAGFSLVM
jgi:hypothetical protein